MISLAIMAHPKRRHFVDELQEQLPGAEVVWDRTGDRWDTGSRAMRAFDPKASHHVVVQDDAIVCRDFVAGVERLTEIVPDNPIALYTGRTRPFGNEVQDAVDAAHEASLRWLVCDGLYWGVGVVMPVPVIESMLSFLELANARIDNYDSKMSFYLRCEGIRTVYPQPSLVDHRDAADGNPSLVEGRTATGRVAHTFIGDASPLGIDWETPAVYLPERGQMRVGEALPSGADVAPTVRCFRSKRTGRTTFAIAGSREARRLDDAKHWIEEATR